MPQRAVNNTKQKRTSAATVRLPNRTERGNIFYKDDVSFLLPIIVTKSFSVIRKNAINNSGH